MKKNLIFSLLFSILCGHQLMPYGGIRFGFELGKTGLHLGAQSARKVHNYAQVGIRSGIDFGRKMKDAGAQRVRAGIDFGQKVQAQCPAFLAGLLFGGGYMKWDTYHQERKEKLNYAKDLDQNLYEAVRLGDLHQLGYLYSMTNRDSIYSDAMKYALSLNHASTIAALLHLKKDPKNPMSSYRIVDPELRMAAAIKIEDAKVVDSLLHNGYSLDKAMNIALHYENSVLWAKMYQQKTGEPFNQSLQKALYEINKVHIKDVVATKLRHAKARMQDTLYVVKDWMLAPQEVSDQDEYEKNDASIDYDELV